MKMFLAIIMFLGLFGFSLSLIYVFNYALVTEDAIMYSMIPATFIPLYQLFNMIWSSFPFFVGLYILIKTVDKEAIYS